MAEPDQGPQRPPFVRKRTNPKQVITSRHRSAHSHSRLNKVTRITPLATADQLAAETQQAANKFNRSKSMDSLALQNLQKKSSPSGSSHLEAANARRLALTSRASRSQGKIAQTSAKLNPSGQKRRTGKAVISIGPDEDNDEDDDDDDDDEDDEKEEPDPRASPETSEESKHLDLNQKSDEVKLHNKQDAKLVATPDPSSTPLESPKEPSEVSEPLPVDIGNVQDASLNRLSQQLEKAKISSPVLLNMHNASSTDEELPSTPVRDLPDTNLRPARSFQSSPVHPQLSNETVLAVAAGSTSLAESALASPGFGADNNSTSVTKSHFLDNISGTVKYSNGGSPIRTLRSGRASAPILSRTQSSSGAVEDAIRRLPPTNSPSFTRTQQKLWLQRESMDHQSPETAEQMNLVERKKEDERITKEYQNVIRYTSPLQDSLQRIRRSRGRNAPLNNPKRSDAKAAEQRKNALNRVSDERLGLSQSLPKSSKLSLSETTITVPHGMQGISSKLSEEMRGHRRKSSVSVLDSQVNWFPQKDGSVFMLEDHPTALKRLWSITYEDPAEAAANQKADNYGMKKDASPSILAQAQQAQQQLLLAQKLQQQNQRQGQQPGQQQGQPHPQQRSPPHPGQQTHGQQQTQQVQRQVQRQPNLQPPTQQALRKAGNNAGTIQLR